MGKKGRGVKRTKSKIIIYLIPISFIYDADTGRVSPSSHIIVTISRPGLPGVIQNNYGPPLPNPRPPLPSYGPPVFPPPRPITEITSSNADDDCSRLTKKKNRQAKEEPLSFVLSIEPVHENVVDL